MGWVFVAPFLIGFLVIYLPMIFQSIQFAFSKMVNVTSGYTLEFVGFENFSNALREDPEYAQILVKNLKELLLNIPALVLFSLFMAVVLNQKMVGRGVFRAIFFIPVIVSTGIIEQIDGIAKQITDSMQNGLGAAGDAASGAGEETANTFVNMSDLRFLFQTMKIGNQLGTYVVNLVDSVYSIVNKSGVQMLIYLAGLQSISPSIYESCYMDGATTWETFWKITLPMISPMILVNTVYTVIDSFTSQDNEVMTYIANAYSKGQQVEATAMAWIYFAIIIVALGIIAFILSRFVFYQKKES